MRFGGVQLRVISAGRSLEFVYILGEPQTLNVFPNFAAVARYAWLAGDRRLAQIGIKAYPQRGMGTDFKQLSDYKVGDAIRHIDWKATFKHGRPIVREFQDERDQCVLFLLDCGRRMRADEGTESTDGSHFDQTRRDALRRVIGRDTLSVDVEPALLPVALVNRYHAIKKSGLM